ncbi:hypothetical protein [Rhodoblastus sp.]|jgi:hypothetical protein|uniref:hypothetical protein n=1 Tax=Rhodoblastus sp. TaxID=1962975 RepID=UPI0026042679|nr:hypothetical protein [Rhodoblastus sp.]
MGRCDECLFWKMARPTEGWCRKYAPKPASEADRVAHWPTTHGAQGCGEFVEITTKFDFVFCGQCRYWQSSATGILPVDRLDKPAQWWTHAGHCIRYAPEPISEPGPRAFWRATHHTDGCSEGVLRPTVDES